MVNYLNYVHSMPTFWCRHAAEIGQAYFLVPLRSQTLILVSCMTRVLSVFVHALVLVLRIVVFTL